MFLNTSFLSTCNSEQEIISHIHTEHCIHIYLYNSVIYRTPCGNPIKRPVIPSDPSNVLAAVLKKRFAAIHSAIKTPEHHDNVSNSNESRVQQIIVLT
jgi:hypothetical protein